MRIMLEVTTKKTVKEQREVEFPFYYRWDMYHDAGGYDGHWCRIDKDGTEWELHFSDRPEAWECEHKRVDLPSTLGYILLNERYDFTVIAATEFYAKLEEFKQFMSRIPPKEGKTDG